MIKMFWDEEKQKRGRVWFLSQHLYDYIHLGAHGYSHVQIPKPDQFISELKDQKFNQNLQILETTIKKSCKVRF